MSFNLENYTAVGFRRDEILPLLERGGLVAAGDIENDSTDGDRGQESSNNYPEWKRVLAVMHDLPFDKAVDSFAGIDPYDDRYLSDDESKARRLYGDMLSYAIECGELTAIRRTVGGTADVACIKLLDLHAWCSRKGHAYPLPPPQLPQIETVQDVVASVPAHQGPWPWGDYTTPLLEALVDAAIAYWSTYDPDDPTTASTNPEIMGYLLDKYVASPQMSDNMARAIATIIRPTNAPTGRPVGKGKNG